MNELADPERTCCRWCATSRPSTSCSPTAGAAGGTTRRRSWRWPTRRVWIELSGLPPKRLPEYYARYDLGRLARQWIFGTDWPGVPGVAHQRPRGGRPRAWTRRPRAWCSAGNAQRVYAGLDHLSTRRDDVGPVKEEPDGTGRRPSTSAQPGRPAGELSDEELEHQGKNAHDTRNWVFLNGTAEQFATHTSRMLELEQEYLRRHPKRTWQGSGGAPEETSDVEVLRSALRGIVGQLEALLALEPAADDASPRVEPADPVLALLARVADQPGGRMHKLEVHQAAREVGLARDRLAQLYTAADPLLATEQQDRVLTDAGRARLAAAGTPA